MNKETPESKRASENEPERPERRRTVWIWLILAWSLWMIVGIIQLWSVTLTNVDIEQARLLFGNDIPIVGTSHKVLASVTTIVFVVAAWNLFMLRSSAVQYLYAWCTLILIAQVYLILTAPNYLNYLSKPIGWGSALFVLAFQLTVVLYALRLKRRGVLV